MQGIRFFKAFWETAEGVCITREAAHTRRYLYDAIKKGAVSYYSEDGSAWKLLKLQEIETPMVDMLFLHKLCSSPTTRKERALHADELAYVIELVRHMACRVKLGEDEFIER